MKIDSALGKVRIKELEELTIKDPKDPWPNFMLGEIYFENEIYEKAVEEYEIAINKEPHVPDFYYKKALSLIKLGKVNEALETLRKARVIDYQNLEIYLFLEGNILDELGRYEEAIKIYEEALKKKFNEWIFEALILDLIEENKINEALKRINEELTKHPSIKLRQLKEKILKMAYVNS